MSPKAASCPKCGHPIADAAKKKAEGAVQMGCLIIVIGIIGLFWWAVSEGEKIREAEKTSPTCVSDYTKCADNKELVERHESNHEVSIAVECAVLAKRLAKYGEPEFPMAPFKSYYPGRSYIDDGVAILVEKDAKYKNGFNALVHTVVKCTYNLKSNQASVEIEDN